MSKSINSIGVSVRIFITVRMGFISTMFPLLQLHKHHCQKKQARAQKTSARCLSMYLHSVNALYPDNLSDCPDLHSLSNIPFEVFFFLSFLHFFRFEPFIIGFRFLFLWLNFPTIDRICRHKTPASCAVCTLCRVRDFRVFMKKKKKKSRVPSQST